MGTNQQHGWTDERVATLRGLWREGVSADTIAMKLGGFEHCRDRGKNAVIGKVHRLNLRDHGTSEPSSRNPRSPKPRKRQLQSPYSSIVSLPVRAPEEKPERSIFDTQHMSREDRDIAEKASKIWKRLLGDWTPPRSNRPFFHLPLIERKQIRVNTERFLEWR